MKQIRRALNILLLATMLLAMMACKEIFHSKEDIDYVDLILGAKHSGSVKRGHRDYYKLNVKQGTKYTINCDVINWRSGNDIKIAAFWYDTGGTLIGEKKSSYDVTATFTASRDGDVVIRVTSTRENEYTIKCYVGSD